MAVHGAGGLSALVSQGVVLSGGSLGRLFQFGPDESLGAQAGEEGVDCSFRESQAGHSDQCFDQFVSIAPIPLKRVEDAELQKALPYLNGPVIEGIHSNRSIDLEVSQGT